MEQDNVKEVHLKFDKETLAKLGSFVGIVKEANFLYVPKRYRENISDKSLWPVWTLKPLSNMDKAKLEDNLGHIILNEHGESEFHTSTGEARIFLLRNNTVKLTNWYIKDTDSFVSYTQNTSSKLMSEEYVDQLDPELQKELESVIKGTERLTDEEKVGLLS